MNVKHVTGRQVYHTKECQAIERSTKPVAEIDRDLAESWGFEECSFCNGTKTDSSSGKTPPEHIQQILEELS